MLEVNELSAGYGGDDVIRNINFKVEKSESLCILGPNGCGKSTLLKSIARIIDYQGFVLLNGTDSSFFPRKEFAKKIALLSQNMQMFFPYTVYDTVSMGRYAYLNGFMKNLSDNDRVIVDDMLKKLDLWNIRGKMIDELSGGTLQRVFLASTLAQTPEIILLDEPANRLDLKHQIDLLAFLKSWVKENNTSLIGVFHDLNLARRFSDSAILMNNGVMVLHDKIDKVLDNRILNDVYEIDIHSFMRESLKMW